MTISHRDWHRSHPVARLSDMSDMTRIHPVVLATVVSAVAAVIAAVANAAAGVGEVPLVIGTLVIASIVGWVNVSVS
jgi:fatty acid desaturase